MSLWSAVAERVRSLLSRERMDAEMDEELRFHLEMETERYVRAGLSLLDARRRAKLEFGGVDRIGEEVRDARGVRPLEEFGRDVRLALRALARRPAFTTVAIATLAIGIGASTAMFTLVNAVLLRPLPYSEPDRLVAVAERTPDGAEVRTSLANVNAWREQSTLLAAVVAWMDAPLSVTGAEPIEIAGRLVSDDYFSMLGVRPLIGRMIQPGDENTPLAILSHRFWHARYGADPTIIGRTIEIGYRQYEVIGVLPPSLPTPPHRLSDAGEPAVWLPFIGFPPDSRLRILSAAARLAPGADPDATKAEMDVIAARLSEALPEDDRAMRVSIEPLQQRMTAAVRPALLLLFGAVSLLLLIACANVANLFLGRAATRRSEMALRRSLGAGPGRLASHAMAEAFVVAAAAGAMGLLLAHAATRAVVAALPAMHSMPRLDEVALDYRVLAFALGVSLVTGLLAGAAPALAGSRIELAGALRGATRGTTGGRTRLRGALVVAEVALAVMLLTGAGLLFRTVQNLLHVDPGMRPAGVLTMHMTLSGQRYGHPEQRSVFVEQLLEQLRSIPEVTSAGTIARLPLGGAKSSTIFVREDQQRPHAGEEPGADIRVIAGDYFRTMRVPVLRGRGFDSTDGAGAPVRFIINDELARRHFAGENPIGKRLAYSWDGSFGVGAPPGYWLSGEIIGVVGSVRETALDAEPSPAIYRLNAPDPWNIVTAVVRVAGDPAVHAPAVLDAVRAVDPTLAVGALHSLESIVADTIVRQRFSMMLLGAFATVALMLVVIGMYGVVAYSVVQRTREIGVRIALGAQRRDVLRNVMGRGLALTAVGILFGMLGALALGRLVSGLLFGVAPTDATTMAASAIVLSLTAALASYLPARRASRIEPASVLGSDD